MATDRPTTTTTKTFNDDATGEDDIQPRQQLSAIATKTVPLRSSGNVCDKTNKTARPDLMENPIGVAL